MSETEPDVLTQHAMLVLWGQFAQAFGLIQAITQVPLSQKTVHHSPQAKILEFFLAILAGLEHLQELNTASEPIVKDAAVARAWLQPGWAHSSGVSRTLTALTSAEAEQIGQVLEDLEQPVLNQEVMLALAEAGGLILDGDLTARTVSDTSQDYPGAAYGRTGENRLGLCYQAAQVSLKTPTYGRLMLSSVLHPGDVVSSTQTKELVQAAEARLGLWPWRRTDLLAQRLEARVKQTQALGLRLQASEQAMEQTGEQLAALEQRTQQLQVQLTALEAEYQAQGKPERPFDALGKMRSQLGVFARQRIRFETRQARLQPQIVSRRTAWVASLQAEQRLRQRLEQLQADNRANPFPIQAVFRLDAGFGSRENLIWLIEMGYEIYTRPCGNWLLSRLKKRVGEHAWQWVGKNAEMTVWKQLQPDDFPYALDVALERFHLKAKLKHSLMLHFGPEPVTQNPADWFRTYNSRQTIEAGIKEGKGTFEMRYLKVRSKPALDLQEQFGRFAANFVRFASKWMAEQCPEIPTGWENPAQPKVKQQVKVGAHTSALVSWQDKGCLIRFTDHSVFAGRSLQMDGSWAIQLALPFSLIVQTLQFEAPMPLFAQKLR